MQKNIERKYLRKQIWLFSECRSVIGTRIEKFRYGIRNVNSTPHIQHTSKPSPVGSQHHGTESAYPASPLTARNHKLLGQYTTTGGTTSAPSHTLVWTQIAC